MRKQPRFVYANGSYSKIIEEQENLQNRHLVGK